MPRYSFNYLDWESEVIQSCRCYETARKHGKPVIVMEPVKGGTLAKIPNKAETLFRSYHQNMSVASWAIRFAASHDNVMLVLSGMSNMEQLMDNTSYMENFEPLTAEEFAVIDRVVSIINDSIAIPCTGCSYCINNCPMNIAIPKYFSLYNADVQELERQEWIYCPVCRNKTRLKMRGDTELKNFPLYCPKCKQECLIEVKDLKITIVTEPDALDADANELVE